MNTQNYFIVVSNKLSVYMVDNAYLSSLYLTALFPSISLIIESAFPLSSLLDVYFFQSILSHIKYFRL